MNDTISRQQTITALRALSDADGYINAPHEVVTDVVRGLPPVRAEQGQTVHSERGETDKFGVKTEETCSDTISRQAAINYCYQLINVEHQQGSDEMNYGQERVNQTETILHHLEFMPSAQQEIVMCKDCKHRPIEKDGEIMPPKEDDWKCPCLCDDYFYSWRPKDNFFCASGERREE